MPEPIIIDTSSLIALERINLLQILCKIYKEVVIPESVIKEFGVRSGDVVYYFTICLVVFGVCLSYAKSCSFRRARVVAACDCARCRNFGKSFAPW
jgi:VanZ family protein